MTSRYWKSAHTPDFSIDLSEVAETYVTGTDYGGPLAYERKGCSDIKRLPKEDADSFLAALKAWRQEQEKPVVIAGMVPPLYNVAPDGKVSIVKEGYGWRPMSETPTEDVIVLRYDADIGKWKMPKGPWPPSDAVAWMPLREWREIVAHFAKECAT